MTCSSFIRPTLRLAQLAPSVHSDTVVPLGVPSLPSRRIHFAHVFDTGSLFVGMCVRVFRLSLMFDSFSGFSLARRRRRHRRIVKHDASRATSRFRGWLAIFITLVHDHSRLLARHAVYSMFIDFRIVCAMMQIVKILYMEGLA